MRALALQDMATEAGVEWGSAFVLDPVCGGGAFLSPVARRMRRNCGGCGAREALKAIVRRLRGFEVDPFAAWMSRVFLKVTLGDLCQEAGTRPPSLAHVCHSLERTPDGESFDLVVSNPPYGRATLSSELRTSLDDATYQTSTEAVRCVRCHRAGRNDASDAIIALALERFDGPVIAAIGTAGACLGG